MLKKMFNFVMFVIGMALVCASMTNIDVKAFDESVNLQDNPRAGAHWYDVRHDHEGQCYSADWIDMKFTYNPILCKREHFHYVLTTENEVLLSVYRGNELVSISRPTRIPMELYLK